jgi:NAD(P)-dependent dehydrogenase (short-subunit alcohol dehydrogenase family)
LDDFRATLDRNVTSAFIAMKTVMPKMMRRRSGSVVLFSTVATSIALPNHEAIAAAKGAVEGLVRTAALSYSRYGIRVNAVAPALTRTPLSASIWQNEKALAVSAAMHPLGRIGEADDIAAAACYFLSAAQNRRVAARNNSSRAEYDFAMTRRSAALVRRARRSRVRR